ncbi:MAG: Nuclease-related domain protein [bacterium ADurb.Bin429]|nr:MAG: Nuclease-related domain protein [bacterium ADurb.Bin429]
MTSILLIGVPVFFLVRWFIQDTIKEHTDLTKRIRDAEGGAWAEDIIGALLTKLPDSYVVIHNLPFAGGDIDHIVVGPTGLFVIDTKSHSGRVLIADGAVTLNGHAFEKDIVGQIHDGAKWLEEMLLVEGGIEVKPIRIIAFTRAYVEYKDKPPYKGVTLLHRSYLNRSILNHDGSCPQIDAIVELLKRKVTIEQPAASPQP